jgi:predicted DNA-binding transcriptional regulator AlpA
LRLVFNYQKPKLIWAFNGADDGTRTRDPHLGKVIIKLLFAQVNAIIKIIARTILPESSLSSGPESSAARRTDRTFHYMSILEAALETSLYLSPKDLGKRWNLCRSSVYDTVHLPHFPNPLVFGRSLRYETSQVREWELARTSPKPEIPAAKKAGRKAVRV